MNKLEQLNEAEKNMFKSLVSDSRRVAKRVWLYSPYRKRYLVGLKTFNYHSERIIILGYYNPDKPCDPEKKEIIIDDSYEQANQQFAELSLKSVTFVH